MTSTRPADVYSLVADIGGTNTRVALAAGPDLMRETIRKYRNAEYPGLADVIRAFVAEEGGVDCRAASVAIAGPVRDGQGALTNLDWTIDSDTLAQATGAETTLVLNDLQAQGHALDVIAPEDLTEILPGKPAGAAAARLVIGVGTGFNVAPVFAADGGRIVPASEAGHTGMPIRSDRELRLARFVETAHGFAATEDVLSGRGIERIYAWLGAEAGTPDTAPSARIIEGCAHRRDPRAVETVEVFSRLLGRAAGNLALDHLPFGGIYLAGGMARAVAPYLEDAGFPGAFRDKGRFAAFMDAFPVRVINDDFAALAGSARELASMAG